MDAGLVIISVILTVIFTAWTVVIDALHLIDKQYFVHHTPRFLQRATFVFAVSLLGWGSLWNVFILFGLNTSIFYLIFDYLLNFLTGKPVLYVGNTSRIDKFWSGNAYLQLTFKITILLIFIILITIT